MDWSIIPAIIVCFIYAIIFIAIPVALLRWLWRKGNKK